MPSIKQALSKMMLNALCHQLTMPSGERIQFGTNVNFIFETDDLKFASPATISRMGMIFIRSKFFS